MVLPWRGRRARCRPAAHRPAARQALADSAFGGPAGLPEIPCYFYVGDDDEQSRAHAEWFADNCRESLGVDLKLIPATEEEFAALYEQTSMLNLDWWSWLQDDPDPRNWLEGYWPREGPFHAEQAGYCNPEVDALVAEAARELDPAKRTALYEEAGQRVVDDVAKIFLVYDTNPRLVKPYVNGYTVRPGDPWPGWSTPLEVDLLERPNDSDGATAATPEMS